MKTNVRIFWLLTVFYAIDSAAYGYWSYTAQGKVEIIGTAAIGMLVFLAGFIAFYLANTSRKFIGPEDLPNANIEDGEAEVGFYSPWSWWPLMLGMTGALAFLSLAIGWWLFFIAFPLALVAIIGFVFEYSRGQHAH